MWFRIIELEGGERRQSDVAQVMRVTRMHLPAAFSWISDCSPAKPKAPRKPGSAVCPFGSKRINRTSSSSLSTPLDCNSFVHLPEQLLAVAVHVPPNPSFIYLFIVSTPLFRLQRSPKAAYVMFHIQTLLVCLLYVPR